MAEVTSVTSIQIAMLLNEKGLLNRSKRWAMQKIHDILSDTIYMGDYYFNVIDPKTRMKSPPENGSRPSSH